jgi:hypothetical protein
LHLSAFAILPGLCPISQVILFETSQHGVEHGNPEAAGSHPVMNSCTQRSCRQVPQKRVCLQKWVGGGQ